MPSLHVRSKFNSAPASAARGAIIRPDTVTGPNEHPIDVDRLLAGAAAAISAVRFCWLATAAENGAAHVRPMGRLPNQGEDEWAISFITDGRSTKSGDLRRSNRVTVIFQNDPALAYVALIGTATLYEREAEVRQRWQNGYNALFSEADRSHAIFVEVAVDRMDLWIRGVTPEPFGMHTTTLERDAGGGWRAV
jgi:general stress protein 26